jgi:hypothetical protein
MRRNRSTAALSGVNVHICTSENSSRDWGGNIQSRSAGDVLQTQSGVGDLAAQALWHIDWPLAAIGQESG